MGWYLVGWAARGELVHLVPKNNPFVIGVSPTLLFDVLIEIPKSCEAVCFFFLPKTWLGAGWVR